MKEIDVLIEILKAKNNPDSIKEQEKQYEDIKQVLNIALNVCSGMPEETKAEEVGKKYNIVEMNGRMYSRIEIAVEDNENDCINKIIFYKGFPKAVENAYRMFMEQK